MKQNDFPRARFSLLLFAGLFFLTPNIALIDVLPDCIGCFLAAAFLSRLSDINEEAKSAKALFLYAGVLGVFRDLFTIAVYSAGKVQNLFELPTLVLLLSFLWSLLKLLLILPALRHLIRCISDLSERCDAPSLWKTKRNKTLPERMERRAVILLILHAIFTTLPELGALRFQKGQSLAEGLYGFVNLYRIMAGAVLAVIFVLWLVFWIGFARTLLSENGFAERVADAWRADLEEHPSKREGRKLYAASVLIGLACLAFLPVEIGFYRVFPGLICAFFALASVQKLPFAKRRLSWLPLLLTGVLHALLRVWYLLEHIPEDALHRTDAYYFFLAVRLSSALEILSLLCFVICAFLELSRVIGTRISVSFDTGENCDEATRHATEKLRGELIRRLKIGLCTFLVSALFGLLHAFLSPAVGFLWIPAALCGGVGLLLWFSVFRGMTDEFVTITSA